MSTKITILYSSSSLLKLLQMNGGGDMTYGSTQIHNIHNSSSINIHEGGRQFFI